MLEGINFGVMEPENPFETPNLPGFHARAWPDMATPVCFWAEILATINIYQI
jgi:hypothetical protein